MTKVVPPRRWGWPVRWRLRVAWLLNALLRRRWLIVNVFMAPSGRYLARFGRGR